MGERRKRKSMWHVEDDNSHPGDDNSWPTWPKKERTSTNNRERDHEFHGSREDDNRHPGDDNSWAAWPNKERHSINNRERDHEFRGPREDDNRRPGDDNSWPAWPDKERHSINNRERDQEFRGSRDFMDPKCRDRLAPQSRELKEENRYCQNMSSGFDDIERRKYKHDSEEGRSNSHRYSRRDMSRSRSRSRSPRSRARSGSPRQDYKNQSHKWSDQRSEHKQFQICRDFSSGRCRKGSQCRFEHSRNTSRGCSSDLRDDAPNYHNREEGKFLKKSRDAVPCREFVKGWCKWGDSCRFSHHLASNETEDVSNPGNSRNSRYDNRSYLSIENEGTNWKTRELGDTGMTGSIANENIANKQENNDVSHDIPRQNEVQNMSLHEQHSMHDHGVVENGGSDVLDEVKKSSNPTHLFHGSENILVPEQYCVSNATDVWQDMVSGGLDGLEAHAGAQLDLHSQVLNHELETQSGARLDLSSQVTNHQFETQSGTHSDLHSQLKNHQFETQLGAHCDLHSQANNPQFETQSGSHLNLQPQVPNRQLAVQILTGLLESKVTFPTGFPQEPIVPVEDSPVTKEHGNYTEQYNQVQVKQISPVSTVKKGPDNRKVDDFETSNRKQEAPLANLEADADNKPIGEECKGVENTKKAEANVASKDEKAMRLFKNSLIEFVKDILKPTWKEGRLSREVHKTIVKKVVDKITSTVQPDHVPKTPDKVDQYLTFSKPKIAKLVQAYVDRFQKMES